jgi:hypothetical protein
MRYEGVFGSTFCGTIYGVRVLHSFSVSDGQICDS